MSHREGCLPSCRRSTWLPLRHHRRCPVHSQRTQPSLYVCLCMYHTQGYLTGRGASTGPSHLCTLMPADEVRTCPSLYGTHTVHRLCSGHLTNMIYPLHSHGRGRGVYMPCVCTATPRGTIHWCTYGAAHREGRVCNLTRRFLSIKLTFLSTVFQYISSTGF